MDSVRRSFWVSFGVKLQCSWWFVYVIIIFKHNSRLTPDKSISRLIYIFKKEKNEFLSDFVYNINQTMGQLRFCNVLKKISYPTSSQTQTLRWKQSVQSLEDWNSWAV